MTVKDIFDVEKIRADFPCLHQTVYGKPLIYFDSAASAQKPRCVIDEVAHYYEKSTANIHRGAHFLSEAATKKYNDARKEVGRFIGAFDLSEIIFTRSTTEAINLVAHGLSKSHFLEGDEIILTEMEHHANIVPWYLLAKEKKLALKIVPLFDDGTLDLDAYKKLFTKRTKLAAFTHASNVLGTINPVAEMVSIAKLHGVPTLIDGAQGVPHLLVDVKKLDVDFYAFSGHKAYGPSGIGVLYAKRLWLEQFPPYQGGGDMIRSVSFDHISFKEPPFKFEAGTPNIEGALGLAQAFSYLSFIGHEKIQAYEKSLHDYAMVKLSDLSQVRIVGTAKDKVSLISFIIKGVHPHDISSIFDREGIALRGGHLCAEPLMKHYNVVALSRASFAFYNTREEIDVFLDSFKRIFEVFRI